jgi:hypothetical protein
VAHALLNLDLPVCLLLDLTDMKDISLKPQVSPSLNPADTLLVDLIIKICFGYHFYKVSLIYIALLGLSKNIALLCHGL